MSRRVNPRIVSTDVKRENTSYSRYEDEQLDESMYSTEWKRQKRGGGQLLYNEEGQEEKEEKARSQERKRSLTEESQIEYN